MTASEHLYDKSRGALLLARTWRRGWRLPGSGGCPDDTRQTGISSPVTLRPTHGDVLKTKGVTLGKGCIRYAKPETIDFKVVEKLSIPRNSDEADGCRISSALLMRGYAPVPALSLPSW
jgi:hypothetical protein